MLCEPFRLEPLKFLADLAEPNALIHIKETKHLYVIHKSF